MNFISATLSLGLFSRKKVKILKKFWRYAPLYQVCTEVQNNSGRHLSAPHCWDFFMKVNSKSAKKFPLHELHQCLLDSQFRSFFKEKSQNPEKNFGATRQFVKFALKSKKTSGCHLSAPHCWFFYESTFKISKKVSSS